MFKIVHGDEDIHTANERRLGEIVGKNIAGKLHSGRNRNEQVVCDMHLWLRDEPIKPEGHLISFLRVTAARAEKEIGCIMPGHTHPQRAQPVCWSHWMLSCTTAFVNDLERLYEGIKRVNRSPLGCGTLAGNPFNIDHEAISKELGFEGILWNSMTGVADRDFITATLQWGSILMQRIYRWSECLIMYPSGKFGFFGGTYNKDLQESWEPMLDDIKNEIGTPMNEISYEQLKAVGEGSKEDIAETFHYEKTVEIRAAKGGTSKSSVFEQIAVLRASFKSLCPA
ncbi:L-Aspartase-like protein [Colletotrichum cereale]|nr:L-Aspartase-like protein [Colletotrichum cereale]